uniref:G-protein coupled receptors family 1 profile domain-containing protein n=1 Tax=Parascaris univalens TaxID=6257 RepID=A0A914ZT88_PARUN
MESDNDHPCHNVAFFLCADTMNISSLIHIIFIFFRLLLITFILIISFTHIGNDPFKWYRKWIFYFLIMHAISFSFTFLALASEFGVYFDEPSIIIRILDVVVTIVDHFLLIVLFVVTGLAITVIVKYKGTPTNAAHAQRTMEQQKRKRLISLIIYSSLSNILNLPSLLDGVLSIAEAFSIKIDFENCLSHWLSQIHEHIHSFRTISLSMCTLIAFAPYRAAFMRIFRCVPKAAVTTIKTSRTTKTANMSGKR